MRDTASSTTVLQSASKSWSRHVLDMMREVGACVSCVCIQTCYTLAVLTTNSTALMQEAYQKLYTGHWKDVDVVRAS